MTEIAEIRKEVRHMMAMGDKITQDLEALEQQSMKDQGKEMDGIPFSEAESRGGAYPLKGHLLAEETEAVRSSYVKALALGAILLRPYGNDFGSGLAALERVRKSLEISEDLKSVYVEAVKAIPADFHSAVESIRSGRGKDAFLIDSLVLTKEMKASGDRTAEMLSHLYGLIGYGERAISEALEALDLIYEGNRMAFIEEQKNWTDFHGEAAACYLDMADDLNLDGYRKETPCYAIWPEYYAGSQGEQKYAAKVLLKVHAEEGSIVKKGNLLFTLYALDERYKDKEGMEDFFGGWLSGFTIRYSKMPSWLYLVHYDPSASDRYKRWFCDKIDAMKEGSVAVEVRAPSDGVIHWSPCIMQEPFACITELDYRVGEKHTFSADEWTEGEVLVGKDAHYHAIYQLKHNNTVANPPSPVSPGDIFVSGPSLTPQALRDMALCKVVRE